MLCSRKSHRYVSESNLRRSLVNQWPIVLELNSIVYKPARFIGVPEAVFYEISYNRSYNLRESNSVNFIFYLCILF